MSAPTDKGAVPALADCWNRIGVLGDQSCPLLRDVVHCRNCAVYAGAAQRNLQRPIGAGYREQWAELLRQPRQEADRADRAVLVFRIGQEWLALPAAMIDSVAPQAHGHRLPHRGGSGLLGVVNVGGTLHPLLSLGTLLGVDENAGSATAGRQVFARLLVVRWEEQAFALPVADLHGIVRYSARSLGAPAATMNKGLVRYLTGVLTEAGKHIGVLDAALVGHQMTRLLR
ncbi:chemotaxis protein CheW [Massilia sp. PAMC28688]|uniref:chemotaxis protein CheW n=1 Tax=Massilia sp. PAMC28688 TaxID=2861283 RepID=UPI001C63AD70|nr:chemotaxis protein CheW [Massilia sp. PAMC28688]QYF93940.1 chemotaxis protein CheW [Massilia sp. PAMC28688]